MFKLSEAGKRYLDNPKTSNLVLIGKIRINLALATQAQLEQLWNNGKGSLVVKVKEKAKDHEAMKPVPTPTPTQTPATLPKKEEKSEKK